MGRHAGEGVARSEFHVGHHFGIRDFEGKKCLALVDMEGAENNRCLRVHHLSLMEKAEADMDDRSVYCGTST